MNNIIKAILLFIICFPLFGEESLEINVKKDGDLLYFEPWVENLGEIPTHSTIDSHTVSPLYPDSLEYHFYRDFHNYRVSNPSYWGISGTYSHKSFSLSGLYDTSNYRLDVTMDPVNLLFSIGYTEYRLPVDLFVNAGNKDITIGASYNNFRHSASAVLGWDYIKPLYEVEYSNNYSFSQSLYISHSSYIKGSLGYKNTLRAGVLYDYTFPYPYLFISYPVLKEFNLTVNTVFDNNYMFYSGGASYRGFGIGALFHPRGRSLFYGGYIKYIDNNITTKINIVPMVYYSGVLNLYIDDFVLEASGGFNSSWDIEKLDIKISYRKRL